MPKSDNRFVGPGGKISASEIPESIGLRDIAVDGEVIFRGLAFVVRDTAWNTYRLDRPLRRVVDENSIALEASGVLKSADGELSWLARFAIGFNRIDLSCKFATENGFLTNRVGLVALHGLAASRGQPVTIGHPDGTREAATFPQLVAPHQTFLELATLDYVSAGGVSVAMDFTGEVFETEDQRNWTDASFKTYGRPLRLPYPYQVLAAGHDTQTIAIRFGATPTLRSKPKQQACFTATAAMPRLHPADATTIHPGPFAERNRLLTSGDHWEWSCCPTVHASDDDTIGETIETIPDLMGTVRSRSNTPRVRIKPLRLVQGSMDDPRRGSVLEAAWVLGTIAGLLDPAVDHIEVLEPRGATLYLVERLIMLAGQQAWSLAWPHEPRVRGLRIMTPTGMVNVICHAKWATTVVPQVGGDGNFIEWLTENGFAEPRPAGALLAMPGFSLAWVAPAR